MSRFRSGRAWTNKSKEIRKRDLFLCQVCYWEVDPLKKINFDNLEVHHIEPVYKDFERRLDNYNLITLCAMHHKKADNKEIDKSFLFEIAKRNEERNK